ncbi:hypothetical protein NP493_21g07016 [Ridgeia piscesae]|uniref:Protein-lysine N-trimethyltransferase SMYD5 n=1 Tax=Ridgeia piscesae TaxID=27915 RepID=A0AAD9PDP5_RIDPI|nr:hypothetical protein NP493_21g07016 [Ridgeia piscesae]
MAAGDSSGVEVRLNLPNKGRALFASRDHAEGESLFEETPIVSAQFLWNKLYKYAACDHCLRSLETAQGMCRRLTNNPSLELPHPECCPVDDSAYVSCPHCQKVYCSATCRDRAWSQYHMTLCRRASVSDDDHPLAKLEEAWRNIHYPPETCSIMLIARMIATVKQAKDPSSALAAFSQFCHTTVNEEEEIAHKLLGETFQSHLELLRSLVTGALYEEQLQQWFTPEGFKSLFALIGTNGQGIGTSSLSVWVKGCDLLTLGDEERESLDTLIDRVYDDLDKACGQFLNCEGSGLYSLQSACNHSCDANAEVTFPHNDFTLCVKALRAIKQGEEVCICYLSECDVERSRHSRQKILK